MPHYLRTHDRLDEASEIFADPLNLASLIRKISIVEPERELLCSEAVDTLGKVGERFFKEKNDLAYAVIKYDRRRKTLRFIVVGNIVLTVVGEVPGAIVKGSEAYRMLLEAASYPKTTCSIVIGRLSQDDLPPSLKSILENALKTRIAFPDAWINRAIYGFKVTRILDEDEYSFKLHAVDSGGSQYIIEIPKLEQVDNTGKLFLNTIDALNYQFSLRSIQYPASVEADVLRKLAGFAKYMGQCIGFITGQHPIDEKTYLELPPCIIRSHSGGVNLERKIEESQLNTEEALFILHRLTGLTALMNTLGYGLNALRLRDVWLVEDQGEPLGYRPVVEYCTSLQRLDSPYRGLYRGLETIDPLILLTNRVTPASNLFMTSSMILQALTNKPILPHLQLNKLISRILFNIETPLLQGEGLEEYTSNLKTIIEQLARGETRVEEALPKLWELVDEYLARYLESLRGRINGRILEYLTRVLSINPGKRVQNPVDMFKILEETLIEDGYSEILVLKT
ncbi:MAG: protein kinase [Desulfurococcus sp.]|uniref:protein kinase n=1 Tax=Desulfurococcus sp. TaxID=51678 RepID=UPI00316004F5